MPEVRSVKVNETFVGDSFLITWTYDAITSPTFQHFVVERAHNLTSEFVQLGTTSFPYFLDSRAEKNVGFYYYYRIKAVDTAYPTLNFTTPVTWDSDIYQYWNANIIRARYMNLEWILRKGFSEDTILLKKKVYGQKCTHGTNTGRRGYQTDATPLKPSPGRVGYSASNDNVRGFDDYQANVPDNCEICYQTGIVGGYERFPGVFKISRTTPQFMNQMNREEGIIVKRNEPWWSFPNPRLQDGDVLVRGDNRRYRIIQVTPSDPVNGFILWQMFDNIEIQFNDLVYRKSI